MISSIHIYFVTAFVKAQHSVSFPGIWKAGLCRLLTSSHPRVTGLVLPAGWAGCPDPQLLPLRGPKAKEAVLALQAA